MSLDCPDCGVEMKERYGKITAHHVLAFEKLAKGARFKTKSGRYWNCPECGKNWSLTWTLKEVKVF